LSEQGPPKLAHSTTPAADNPRRVAVLIDDLFDVLRFNAVLRNVLNVVVIPLRLQLLEPLAVRVSRRQRPG